MGRSPMLTMSSSVRMGSTIEQSPGRIQKGNFRKLLEMVVSMPSSGLLIIYLIIAVLPKISHYGFKSLVRKIQSVNEQISINLQTKFN